MAQVIAQGNAEAKTGKPRPQRTAPMVAEAAGRKRAAAVGMTEVQLIQGQPSGAAQWMPELGLAQALGEGRAGHLALWQVLARVIEQGSRLSARRRASSHACGFLGLPQFSENDLYDNLDGLALHQEAIEQALFARRPPSDVTSGYLEGQCNEWTAFGYNRDGKRGKPQGVIGLCCAMRPVCLEPLRYLRAIHKTLESQINKLAVRFGAKALTVVGERAMIKSAPVQSLSQRGWNYIDRHYQGAN